MSPNDFALMCSRRISYQISLFLYVDCICTHLDNNVLSIDVNNFKYYGFYYFYKKNTFLSSFFLDDFLFSGLQYF